MQQASACTTHQEAALIYARAGFPVFPCNVQKRPLTQHGFKDATTDEKAIRDAWDANPEALIGLPTGAITGLVVIDLDCKSSKDGKEKNGIEEYARIMGVDLKTAVPSVPTVQTPSGGLHLYFEHPGVTMKSTSDKIAPGVDTRADGGYVIVPCSKVPAGRYTSLGDAPLGPMPETLVAVLRDAGIIPAPSGNPSRSTGVITTKTVEGAAIASALYHISPDCDYGTWIQVGLSLHEWNRVDGLELWEQWSAQGKKHVPGETARKWVSFGKQPAGSPRITIRSLFALARANGYVHGLQILNGQDPLAEKYGNPIICRTENRCDINQQYLAAYHVQKTGIIFDAATGTLWEYNPASGLYRAISKQVVMQGISESYAEVLNDNGVGHLLATRTQVTLRQVCGLVEGIASRDNPFRVDHGLIHVANGMLSLSGGQPELLPFSPDYFSRNRSEVPWDPNASCPEYLAALAAVMDEDDQRVFQEYTGQCLLGRNISQRLVVLHGPALLGKSQLQRMVIQLVGANNVTTLRPNHLDERFEQNRYVGRTLLIAADVTDDFLASDSAHNIKTLVGDDYIDTERKNSSEITSIRGNFNLLVTSNADIRVRLTGDRGAWERRLILLECSGVKPAKIIPEFAQYLISKEGPGILKWAVEGAVRLLANTAAGAPISLTTKQQERVSNLLDLSDSITAFVQSCVIINRDADVTTGELYQAYDEFCSLRGWETLPQRKFERDIAQAMQSIHGVRKSHGIIRAFDQTRRGYRGVQLVATSDLSDRSAS